MTFKVGDRVVYDQDGDTGLITRVNTKKVLVSWDGFNGQESWISKEDISKSGSRCSGVFDEVKGEFVSTFEQSVRYHTNKIADLLIAKNKAYGDSALNPVRIFSKASRIEQLNVRIDDKISRIQRGTDFGDEDTVRDLIGYLVLRLIAEESE